MFSGLIGAASYWSVRGRSSATRAAALAEGLNMGMVVGFILGFPAGALVAFARLTGLIGP